MADILQRLEYHFSARAFFLGLCVVAGLFTTLFGILGALQNQTLSRLEERLGGFSVPIEQIVSNGHASLPVSHAQIDVIDHHSPEVLTEAAPSHVSGVAHQEDVSPEASTEENDLAILTEEKSLALPEAPIDGVFEESAGGIIPTSLVGGLTPFKAYRKPFVLNRDKPALAVSILGYGLSRPVSEQILKDLPASVSLVLSPYSPDADRWQKAAREDGHEVWLQLMAQTRNFPKDDPGAMALMPRLSLKNNQEHYMWTLARTTGYAGLAAFTDKTLSDAGAMFQPIAEDIFRRGLGYFELSADRYSFFESFAGKVNAPNAHNQFHIKDLRPDSLQIEQVTKMIADNGGAIVTVEPTPMNIQNLKLWLASIQAEGVQIAPLSALAGLNNEDAGDE